MTAEGWPREYWLCWKVVIVWDACWRTWALGKSFVLTRIWFHLCHIVHITMAMRSIFFRFSWTNLSRSLIFEMPCYLRSLKSRIASQILSSMVHSHNAWITVSVPTPHCSHLSSNKILLFIKLCFTSMASLQARHIKFHNLLGTLSPQIWFHTSLCCCVLTEGTCIEVSFARNFEPEFTV